MKLTLHTTQQEHNEQELRYYWRFFTSQLSNLMPTQAFIQEETPVIEESSITINVNTEAEGVSLKRKLEEHFHQFCDAVGLKKYHLIFNVSTEMETLEEFRKQTMEEDKIYVQNAVKLQQERQEKEKDKPQEKLAIGYNILDEPMEMRDILEEERRVTVQGYVFISDVRELRSGRSLLILKATDYTDSLEIKMFSRQDDEEEPFSAAKEGIWIRARGRIQTDQFSNELTMMANDIQEIEVAEKMDEAEEKRVELHAHTTMSQLDAVVSPERLIEQAAKWGHSAIAITDHAVVQAYPSAYAASKKHGVKVLYGVEANVVDDGIPIAYNVTDFKLDDAVYVVFDVETTGLSSTYDTIIELAGVKIQHGEVIDTFESFANPHRALPDKIIEITGITDDMLVDAPEVDGVLEKFHEWVGDSVLVAHNATFDIGFLNQGYAKIDIPKITNPYIDTLELARFLLPELGNHRLNTLCKHLEVELTQHHRAIYDAEATAEMFWKLVARLDEQEITNHEQLNNHMGTGDSYQHSRPFHSVLLAQNEVGLKNLYKLISYSHTDYFYRVPRIPRSVLEKHREGLLVGSACDDGEVFDTLMLKSVDEAMQVAEFYDYLEVQPPESYYHLIEREVIQNEAQILDILRNVVEIGKRLDKLVVATGNVHHIDETEKLYRQILIASQKGNPLNRITLPNMSYRTTTEMLEMFSFLGSEKAEEIVITNTQKISDKIEEIAPLKDTLYTPSIEGAEEDIRNLTYNTATSIYGSPLPEIVEKRITKELDSIIGHGFAVIYLISHKLVKKSLLDGYLVGSRGSVGSSIVATMTNITEVNPLPAHYVCTSCHYHKFFTNGEYASGFDLPDKDCPTCGEALTKDGQDIPFETF